MKLGVRGHDYGRYTAKELSELIKEEGLEAVQVVMHKVIKGIEEPGQVTQRDIEEVVEAFSVNNIEIPVLGCYIEPSLLDKEARLKQVELFNQFLEYGKIANAGMVGTETTNFTYPESDRKKVYEIMLDSILRMVEKAEATGSIVGIEPVKAHTLATPELTYKMLNEVKSDKLKIIFDPINLLSPDCVDKQDQLWEECFEAFGDKIEAMHLKDAIVKDGAFEEVLLGEGFTNYEKIFSWVGVNKPHISLIREGMIPTHAKQDIAFMKQFIDKY